MAQLARSIVSDSFFIYQTQDKHIKCWRIVPSRTQLRNLAPTPTQVCAISSCIRRSHQEGGSRFLAGRQKVIMQRMRYSFSRVFLRYHDLRQGEGASTSFMSEAGLRLSK